MNNNYRILFSVLFVLFGLLAANKGFADGSKDLYPDGVSGYRASLYLGNASPSYPFPSPGIHYVYAEAGEVITLASSATQPTGVRFTVYDVFGNEVSLSVADTDGRIANRAAELAGPAEFGAAAVGAQYVPVYYTAPQTGIYRVELKGDASGKSEAGLADGNWTNGTDGNYLAAWDIAVYHSGEGFIPGRVYANVLNMGLSGNQYGYGFYGVVYALTKDGYTYRVNPNGLAGALFTFFVNNNGFSDTETKQPIYKSLNTTNLGNIASQGYQIHNPNNEDTETSITHKMFYTLPADDLPTGEVNGAVPGGQTWLRNEVVRPAVNDVMLIGVDGTVGQVSNKGGVISFVADAQGQYTVVIESTTTNPADPNYFVTRKLTGTSVIGTNEVLWDGKDGATVPLPQGDVPATITVKMQGAEVHFPYFDVENNPNGIVIERLDPDDLTQVVSDTVYWDDSDISNSGTPPNPKVNSHLSATDNEGRLSNVNGHIFSGMYGNEKSLDTWTFIMGEEVVVPTVIRVNESDLEVESFTSNLSTPVSVGSEWTYTSVIHNYGPSGVATNTDPDVGPVTQGAVFRLYVPEGVTISTLPSDIVFTGDAGVEIVGDPTFIDGVFEAIVDMPANSGATIVVNATATGAVSTHEGTIYAWSTILRPNDYTDINATNPDVNIPPTDPFFEAEGIREVYGDIVGEDPTTIDLSQTNNIKLNGELAMVADLSITKELSAAPWHIQAPVTFTLTVVNNGPSDATGVVVSDLLPDGYLFISGHPSAGSYDEVTGDWTIGNLSADAGSNTETLSIVAEVQPTGNYTNIATISSDVFDDDLTNNEDEAGVVTPAPAEADLAIEKTVDNGRPTVGAAVTFTLTVTNNGPSRATGITVEDIVPDGYNVNSVTVEGGTWSAPNWTIPSLPSGQSYEMTITAAVLATGTYDNTATVEANEDDPVGSNNTDEVLVELAAPSLKLLKAADFTGPVTLGDAIAYTFKVSNVGNVTVENIVVADPMLGGTIPNTSLATGSSWPSTIGTLAPGESVTLAITYTVLAGDVSPEGYLENTAEVSGDDPANPGETLTPQPSNTVIVSLIDNCDPASGSVDTDGDGIADVCDLDDDNDGILDTDECSFIPSPLLIANTDQGELVEYNTVTNNLTVLCSGVTVAGGIVGDIAMDSDGNIWGITSTNKLVRIDPDNCAVTEVVPDLGFSGTALSFLPDGNLLAGSGDDAIIRKIDVVGGTYTVSEWANFGTGFSNGDFIFIGNKAYVLWFDDLINATDPLLFEVAIDADFNYVSHTVLGTLPRFTWGLAKANGDQLFGVTGVGADGTPGPMGTIVRINMQPSFSWRLVASYHQYFYGATSADESTLECDTDGDGIPNRLDPDSDNDGCPDAVEYYGAIDPIGDDINPDGTVTDASYSGDYTNVVRATQLSFTAQPGDVVVQVGSDAVFPVTAQALRTTTFDGGSPDYEVPTAEDISTGLIYQWQESVDGGGTWTDLADGGQYSGTTTDELTISNIILDQKDNQYQVIITHSAHICPEISATAAMLIPSFTLVKSVTSVTDAADVVRSDGHFAALGDKINYGIVVTNTGNVALSDLEVTDPLTGFSTTLATLAPGAAEPLETTHIIDQDDLNAGIVLNTAIATGKDPGDNPVDPENPDEGEVETPGIQNPELTVTKVITSTGPYDSEGDVISYDVVVTNTGNVTIDNIVLTDDNAVIPTGEENIGTLEPTQGKTITVTHTVTLDDLNAGSVSNQALVNGEGPGGTPIPEVPSDDPGTTDPDDPTDTAVEQHPELTVTKVITSTGPYDSEGDIITYDIVVTNTGNVTIDNIELTDDNAVIPTDEENIGTLEPTQGKTITVTHAVTLDDLNAGSVSNQALVNGEGPDGTPIPEVPSDDPGTTDPDDPTDTAVEQHPELTVTKVITSTGPYDSEGDVITYDVVVTNTGNVTIDNIVLTDDNAIIPTGEENIGTLEPTQGKTITVTHTVTLDDLNTGSVSNQALVNGEGPGGTPIPEVPSDDPGTGDPDDPTDTAVEQHPELTVTKVITSTGPYDSEGDVITYDIVVTNTGNVTIDNIVLTDDNAVIPTGEENIGTLDPTKSVTIAVTHTVTLDDLNAGSVSNQALVNGEGPGGTPIPEVPSDDPGTGDPDDPTETAVEQHPELTVTKVITSTGPYDSEGEIITYDIVVTNTGNVTIDNIVLTDDNAVIPTGEENIGTLEPTQGKTITVTHTVTLDDLNTGSVSNQALVNGEGPDGTPIPEVPSDDPGTTDPDDPTDTAVEQHPELTVTKVITSAGPYDSEGDVITYDVVVTNTGNVTIDNIVLADDNAVIPTGEENIGTLEPTQSKTITVTHTVTLDDLNNGSVSNQALVNGEGPDGTPIPEIPSDDPGTGDPDDPTIVGVTANPALSFAKTGILMADDNTIEYTFTVTNTGNVTMTDIAVSDPKITVPIVLEKTILAPGESTSGTVTYTITQTEKDSGEVENLASVTGTPPFDPADPDSPGKPINPVPSTPDPDNPGEPGDEGIPTVVDVPANPVLTLTKKTRSEGPYKVNDYIEYEIIVQNTGNVTLADVTVKDDNAEITGGSPIASLAPNQTATVTARHRVTQADIDAGTVVNQAKVTGNDPGGDPIVEVPSDDPDTPQPNDPTVEELTQKSGLSLAKRTISEGPYAIGQHIEYEIIVRNTGNVTLTDVTVTDENAEITGGSPIGSLAPNQTATVTARHQVTQDDLDAGTVVNQATVTGNDPEGKPTPEVPSDNPNTPQPNDPTVVELTQKPGLSLTKRATGEGPYAIGQYIRYELTVRNTGNVTLTDVTVTDDNAEITGGSPIGSLAPNQTATVTARHQVTQTDIDAGTVVNQAKVTGNDPEGDPIVEVPSDDPDTPEPNDPTVEELTQKPGLALSKRMISEGPYAIGQYIRYELTVRNRGNVTLRDVTVTDENAEITGGSPIASLAPNATATVFARHRVTQGDINAGTVLNQAKVGGNDPQGDPVPEIPSDNPDTPEPNDPTEVELIQKPGLTLAKRMIGEGPYVLGQYIRYELTVRNTGNVTLTDVTVTDENAEITGGSPIASLAPNATATVFARHRVTQSDLDAGSVVNQAKVRGNDPEGKPVPEVPSDNPRTPEPNDPTEVAMESRPSLSLTKGVTSEGPYDVGDQIKYFNIVVTNTGNVTLTDVVVSDDNAEIISGSPIARLLPGESATVMARHVVTQSDMDAGEVINQAQVSGNDPEGNRTPEFPSDDPNTPEIGDKTITPVTQTPGIRIEKVADRQIVEMEGDQIVYQLQITNTGNVTLYDVEITDPLTGFVQQIVQIRPGINHTQTFRTRYIIKETDLSLGKISNTATVSAHDPEGKEVTHTATVEVEVYFKEIDLEDDDLGPIDGRLGGDVGNVFTNDKINSEPLIPGKVTLTAGTVVDADGNPVTGIVLNPDGTVRVSPGTPAGTYSFNYGVCDVINPNNCDEATVTVEVAPTEIEASDDRVTGVNGYEGTRGVINVLSNDELGGAPIVPEEVELTLVRNDPALQLNPDGSVDVVPGTRGGTYTLEYQICEVLNPDNCSTGIVEVVVVNPLKIPNVFTPNGDGKNDRFEIIGIEGFDRVSLVVVNRWGNEVYRNVNYRNDWDGSSLNEGTYYYVIVTEVGGSKEQYTGWILIKR